MAVHTDPFRLQLGPPLPRTLSIDKKAGQSVVKRSCFIERHFYVRLRPKILTCVTTVSLAVPKTKVFGTYQLHPFGSSLSTTGPAERSRYSWLDRPQLFTGVSLTHTSVQRLEIEPARTTRTCRNTSPNRHNPDKRVLDSSPARHPRC